MAQSFIQGGGDEWGQTPMGPMSPKYPANPSTIGGTVKQLPFQKATTSTPKMGMLDPAFKSQMGYLQQAAPDFSSYFTQLSNQAFEDANRQSARLSAAHGGAPTASTGNTGQNQGAYQGMLFDQLNKSNVDRMWNTQDAWNTNRYNKGADAYKDYFGAIANKAYDTGEEGYTSSIYTPRDGGGGQVSQGGSTIGTGSNTYEGGGSQGGGGGAGGGGRGGGSSPPGSIGGAPYGGSHPPGGGSWGGGAGGGSTPSYWGYGPEGDQSYDDTYSRRYGDGSYDDPYGGGSQGGLDSYLSEIAQGGAGTPAQDEGGYSSKAWEDYWKS